VHRVLVGKSEGKRPLGRPRRRWEDNIKMDLREVGEGGDWMDFLDRRCFHFLCMLFKSFPGSLSKHFHFLSSADIRSCPVREFRDCLWV